MSNFEEDVNRSGRVYEHTLCGGMTRVDGVDFVHVCDPFWPCRSTYCCQCADFSPMDEVRWLDTGESLLDYRNRLRTETPLLVQVWRFGGGLLVGGAMGAAAGLLVGLIGQAAPHQIGLFAVLGGLAGAILCYFVGTLVLNLVFAVDYRRMR